METERRLLDNRLRFLSLEQIRGQRTIAETKKRRKRLIKIKKEKDKRLELVISSKSYRKLRR